MRLAVLIALAAGLAACGHTPRLEPVIDTVEVQIPIPVPCVSDATPDRPAGYADTDAALLAAPDMAARYRLLIAGRDQRDARLAEIEPVVEGCRGPP
jgi:hypothetical protein